MEGFQAFLTATPVFALFTLCVLYAIGEFVGTYTKAWIPSVFVIAVLFLVGYWTVLPKDIVKIGGLGAPLGGIVAIMVIIVHMGTAISLKELGKQWRIILICLAGLAGMIALCLALGFVNVIDFNYIIAGLPPLTGGIVAATMMQAAAQAAGLEKVAVLAICMYVCQGFAGYPLTAIMLKKKATGSLAHTEAAPLRIRVQRERSMKKTGISSLKRKLPRRNSFRPCRTNTIPLPIRLRRFALLRHFVSSSATGRRLSWVPMRLMLPSWALFSVLSRRSSASCARIFSFRTAALTSSCSSS